MPKTYRVTVVCDTPGLLAAVVGALDGHELTVETVDAEPTAPRAAEPAARRPRGTKTTDQLRADAAASKGCGLILERVAKNDAAGRVTEFDELGQLVREAGYAETSLSPLLSLLARAGLVEVDRKGRTAMPVRSTAEQAAPRAA